MSDERSENKRREHLREVYFARMEGGRKFDSLERKLERKGFELLGT